MNRPIFSRVLEVFFRHPVAYLLPIIAMTVAGFFFSARSDDVYSSRASVVTNRSSLVTDLSGVGPGANSFMAPAQFASQELFGLLSTDVFMADVLSRAGFEVVDDPSFRSAQLVSARRSFSAFPASENLMEVRVTTGSPAASQLLAGAAVDAYIDFKVEALEASSEASLQEFSELAARYETRVDDANEAVDQFTAELGGTIDELTPSDATEYERLLSTATNAEALYSQALADVEASRLSGELARSSVQQSLYIVDPPRIASQPDSGVTGQVLSIGAFGFAGLLLSLVAPTAVALLDRGVMFDDELAAVARTDVLAIVPRMKRKQLRTSGLAEVPLEDAGAIPRPLSRPAVEPEPAEGDAEAIAVDEQATSTRWTRAHG